MGAGGSDCLSSKRKHLVWLNPHAVPYNHQPQSDFLKFRNSAFERFGKVKVLLIKFNIIILY